MPTLDDQFRNRLRDAAPEPSGADDVFAALARRRRRRATNRAAGKVGLVAVVLAGTIVGFAALRDAFRADGVPQTTPEPTVTQTASPDGELGLGFPVCRVTSMPIATASGEGTASVFTRASDEGCPRRGDGFSGVAIDVDGDGVADASVGPLEDCFSLCEAFAAPDVDGDGLSEVVISTQGADGYGLWLYDVSVDPPALEPVVVEDPTGIGFLQTGPFGFAWVGAAAHRADAVCTTHDGAAALEVRSTDVGKTDATMHTTTLAVTGTIATVVDADTRTITLDEVPGPGNELCGSPLYNSAASFPDSADGNEGTEGQDIGLGFDVCLVRGVDPVDGFDLLGDGTPTTVWLVHPVKETGNCGDTYFVAADLSGDGAADAWTGPIQPCRFVGCGILDAADLDADGDEELITFTYFSIMDQTYFSARATDGAYSIEPILVAPPGHPDAEIEPGAPLVTSAAGDAGYASWIRCEGFPDAPVLVWTWASGPIDPDVGDLTEWHETKLELREDGSFHVVATNDLELPADQDPDWIRSDAPACGVDFNLLAPPNPGSG